MRMKCKSDTGGKVNITKTLVKFEWKTAVKWCFCKGNSDFLMELIFARLFKPASGAFAKIDGDTEF